MSSPADDIVVRHNPSASRFEAEVEGHLSVADCVVEGDRAIFTHTFVPPELRGRGIAERLVRTALGWAVAERLTIVPQCSYVAVFLQRHPEMLNGK
ncbi:MAG: hypothetical protein JWM32_1716 [Verrucomicrobia bacterium]|nr:hypothetical protein [Verrucomicrobiota bacterium]